MFVIDLNVIIKRQSKRHSYLICVESDGYNYSQEHAEYWPATATPVDEEGHRHRSNDGKDRGDNDLGNHIKWFWWEQSKTRPSGMVILSERHADCHYSHNKNRTSHLWVLCFYSLRDQHSQTRKSCMNTILSMLNCVAVKDLFSRPSADWCLCTCINVSDLWH